MNRLGWGVVAAAAAGLVLAAPAQAVLPTPGTEVGGGAQYAGKGTSRVLIAAKVKGDGRTVRIAGTIGSTCSKKRSVLRAFKTAVELTDEGSFSASSAPSVPSTAGGYGATAPVDVSGVFDGASATGTVLLHDIDLDASKQTCPDAKGAFTMRDPGRPTGPPVAAPAPGTNLYGLTDLKVQGVRGPVIARVTKSGKGLGGLTFRTAMKPCSGVKYFSQYSPTPPLTADGRFDRRERFAIPYNDAIDRWRGHTRGSFLAGGALQGRWTASIRTHFTKGRLKGETRRCNPAASVFFWAVP